MLRARFCGDFTLISLHLLCKWYTLLPLLGLHPKEVR